MDFQLILERLDGLGEWILVGHPTKLWVNGSCVSTCFNGTPAPPTMVTKFRVDDRLQVTVPVEMRTRNPEGVATYTNFRRFGVDTDTTIVAPPPSDPLQR